MGGKAPKIKAGPLEKQQARQLEEMERLFGPVREWLTGQGMSALMGGRNPFSQQPNPQMERAYLDHINVLRGLQGAYNQAYGNLGNLGSQMLGGAWGANMQGGGSQWSGQKPTAPEAPDLSDFNAGMSQFIAPMMDARNQIIAGALPQALNAFNPHLDIATMEALAAQGRQAREGAIEKSPMRGGRLASTLNDIGSQEAMAKSALTYQAGEQARQNALNTLGPAAMSDQVAQALRNQIEPALDIFRTQANLYGTEANMYGTDAQVYGMDKASEDARLGRLTQMGLAGMPWIEQGQLGGLNMTRDLSSDIMGLISSLYGGAEEAGINRALGLLGGSAFPNANAIMGQGSQLAAMEQQRRAANAKAAGDKKGGIGGGLAGLVGMLPWGRMFSGLGKGGGGLGGLGGLLNLGGASSGQGGVNPFGGWRRY